MQEFVSNAKAVNLGENGNLRIVEKSTGTKGIWEHTTSKESFEDLAKKMEKWGFKKVWDGKGKEGLMYEIYMHSYKKIVDVQLNDKHQEASQAKTVNVGMPNSDRLGEY